jgi:hypothetical protein
MAITCPKPNYQKLNICFDRLSNHSSITIATQYKHEGMFEIAPQDNRQGRLFYGNKKNRLTKEAA